MTLYSLDIGNAFSNIYNGKQLWQQRSVIAPVQSYLNVRGDKQDTLKYKEKIYHIGDGALKYPLYRMFAEHDKQSPITVNDSVAMTLMLLEMSAGYNPKKVEAETDVVVQVPESITTYQQQLVSGINGLHIWESNGKQYQTRIRVQEVYPEGYGSWFMAHRQNVIGSSGATIVIDVGGGTVVATAFENQSGELLSSLSYTKAGVVRLANLVRDDVDLRSRNDGIVLSVEDVFQAIETGTYRVGVNGVDIKDTVRFYLPEWWNNTFRAVINDFSNYFHRKMVSKILVTGGGAEIVRNAIEGTIKSNSSIGKLFAIASQPLIDNTLGIYYATTSQR